MKNFYKNIPTIMLNFQKIENVVTQNLITTVGLMVTAVLTLLRMTDLTKVCKAYFK